MFKPCFLIPHYNHAKTLSRVIEGLKTFGLPFIVIDDGSEPEQAREAAQICKAAGCTAFEALRVNRGKGAAVMMGFIRASALGFTHAIQVDADGQHDLTAVPSLIDEARKHPSDVVTGYPIYGEDVPKARKWGRYLTHVWVWIETLSFSIRDSMCGFRVYPLKACVALIESERLGQRMAFDSEILVRLYWRGLKVREIPVKVSYPKNGVSHFLMVKDNALISWAHTRLFFGMLKRCPSLLIKKRDRV